ncbi:helix-turn-helix domain-containing protein, partial [Rhodomicrobium vannielii ATCC 17100]|uniref:helix-turn-helix domain-containing protein n=1 Tax=Rhodomicrobium vannielii TaxID=1069 RepID=UPI0019193B6C
NQRNALAESSGLDVRTIQRIEAGERVSVTTRRALARGLGYTNPDIFEDPNFIKGVDTLFESIRKAHDEDVKKQLPDHIRVAAEKVISGEKLACIAYDANAYVFQVDEGVSDEAKELAANIFDFLRDLADINDFVHFLKG